MNTYLDLITQTFEFPQEEFEVKDGELYFHGIRMMDIVEKYETPMKISYLPVISQQIQQARKWFADAMKKCDYKGNYRYAYCTKSSHFSFVLEEGLKNNIDIETSSAYDIDIVRNLHKKGLFSKDQLVISNGFKRALYTEKISELINEGFNCIPVLDNMDEINAYEEHVKDTCNLGIRMAADEEPNFEFYTSRLGVRYNNLLPFYQEKIKPNPKFKLKMLHFFINYGIKDTAYYWSELNRFVESYCTLRKECPDLNMIDIGGGFPIKLSLGFEYDYEYMVEEIVDTVNRICKQHGVPTPDILTEFGTYTVGESGAALYSILGQKLQNDKELWYMIDSSFMTNLPDSWGLNQRFILLPLNLWNNQYQAVNVGGLSCDSLDYYNSETHSQQVFLPEIKEGDHLYIGLFHTAAYQEALGGFGGLQHCLIPSPKFVLIDDQKNSRIFRDEQSSESMMEILGYK